MTGETQDLDNEIRALYAGSLDGFVKARQALATRLKEAGDTREAEVRVLRKPSVSAWAVNHLFASHPHEMAEFLGAGERARTLQHGGSARGNSTLRDLIAAVRGALPRLVALGSQALAAAGRPAGEAIVERLRSNLEALAFDPAQAATAARRWLDEDLPPPGFEVMASLQLAASAPATSAKPQPSGAEAGRPGATRTHAGPDAHADRRAGDARAGKENERRIRIERLRRELVAAEREAAERLKDAEDAAATLERTQQSAARMAREAAAASQRSAEARRAARDAEQAAARARAALESSERESG